MIKACVFDCDGTLLDTIQSIAYCGNRTMKDLGFREFDTDAYKLFVGDGAATLVRRCLQHAGDTKCEHFERAFARYKEYFAVDCMYKVAPYEGVVQVVEELKKLGIAVTVLSNKPHEETKKVIADTFGSETFDYVQGQVEGVPIKPAPDGALKIAEVLDVKPEECLYIGDTGTDMKTGNAAGMYTVGVLWGFRDKKELAENQAKIIIEKPEEILKLVKEI